MLCYSMLYCAIFVWNDVDADDDDDDVELTFRDEMERIFRVWHLCLFFSVYDSASDIR